MLWILLPAQGELKFGSVGHLLVASAARARDVCDTSEHRARVSELEAPSVEAALKVSIGQPRSWRRRYSNEPSFRFVGPPMEEHAAGGGSEHPERACEVGYLSRGWWKAPPAGVELWSCFCLLDDAMMVMMSL